MVDAKFKDSRGKIIQVVELEGNIAILNSGERVAKDKLNNPNYYVPLTENVQPVHNAAPRMNENDSFGGTPVSLEDMNNRRYNSILEKANKAVSNVDTDRLGDDNQLEYERRNGGSNSVKIIEDVYDNGKPTGQESAQDRDAYRRKLEEDRNRALEGEDDVIVPPVTYRGNPNSPQSKDAIDRFIRKQENGQKEMNHQINTLSEYLDEEGKAMITQNGGVLVSKSMTMADLDAAQPDINEPYNREKYIANIAKISKSQQKHPMGDMYDSAKRTMALKLNINISEKIPGKDIIKMFEENFEEHSAIEYYADEIYKKLMEDPKIIRDQIEKTIRDMVTPPKKRVTTSKTASKTATATKTKVNRSKVSTN